MVIIEVFVFPFLTSILETVRNFRKKFVIAEISLLVAFIKLGIVIHAVSR